MAAHSADYAELSERARRIYAEQLVKGNLVKKDIDPNDPNAGATV